MSYNVARCVTISSPLKERLEKVAHDYQQDKEIVEKISICFIGLRTTWKTAAINSLCLGKLPSSESEVPLYFAHGTYDIQLNEDHKVCLTW
jgi:hypothetical protein